MELHCATDSVHVPLCQLMACEYLVELTVGILRAYQFILQYYGLILTARPRLSAKLVTTFADRGVSCNHRDGSLTAVSDF
jgi:hypothetical protein